ncbi:hypothetical protein V8E54_003146 [Elaphomyces granulatus]
MPSLSWNYQWKWPLTRAERLKELDELSVHYDKTPQRANINAVKLWHSQFPENQIIPCEVVTFQGGKKVDEAEIDLEDGVIWDELNKGKDPPHWHRTSHPRACCCVQWTYYNRAYDSHIYQV